MTDSIFIPQPAEWVSLNERTHWRPRSQKTKAWRRAAEEAAEDHDNAYPWTVDITAHIHKGKGPNRYWDPHNLMPTVKAIIDGLVDAVVLKNDDTRYVHNVAILDGGRRDEPGVTITISRSNA